MRKAFKMKLKQGCVVEYKKRHDEIWPELSRLLTEAGIRDYSIYLDEETGDLFAFQRLTPDNQAAKLPNHPIMKKWWDANADLMECNPDNSPVEIPLAEMFHMD